jgi:hypothetical protein
LADFPLSEAKTNERLMLLSAETAIETVGIAVTAKVSEIIDAIILCFFIMIPPYFSITYTVIP